MHAKQEAFIKAVEDYRILEKESFQNLEITLTTKRRERDDLDTEYEQAKKNKKIAVDQEILEYSYQAALKILDQHHEKAVPITDYEALLKKCTDLEKKFETEIKAAVESERQSQTRSREFEKRTLILEHEKANVSDKSVIESLRIQLKNAETEMAKAQTRLDNQIELTKDIAKAASAPSVVQNYSK